MHKQEGPNSINYFQKKEDVDKKVKVECAHQEWET